ncbi:MAG: flagellar assembly protein A [Dissulfurimicrobium sp.]|uniref:flagellar assembly protein A n=2 Tax=Dissulfurimicrobium sp. TaxID=2022436 RepID=UPI00404A6E44
MKDDKLLGSPALLAEAIYETMLETFIGASTQAAFMTLPPVGMTEDYILADAIRIVLRKFNINLPEEIYARIRSGSHEKFAFQTRLAGQNTLRPRHIAINCQTLARNMTITGEPPINGKDGEIALYFDYKFTTKTPTYKDNVAFDLKELQFMPQTKGNELLLKIYGPTKGFPGTDIFGAPIPPIHGRPHLLELGEGVAEKPCLSEEINRSCKAVYSVSRGIILLDFIDDIKKPQNLRKISICNKIEIMPIDLVSANLADYPYEFKSMADVVVKGDLRGPISIIINGDIIIQGAIECKKIEVSKTIKANFAKAEIEAGELIDIDIALNAILNSKKTIRITKEIVHSKLNTRHLILQKKDKTEILCAYLQIIAEKIEMDGISIRNIVEINLGKKLFNDLKKLNEKTTKILALLEEIKKDTRERIIILVEKIKSQLNEENTEGKKTLGFLLDILAGMIKGHLTVLKTKKSIENWITTYGQQFYSITKKALQLIPVLDSYSSAQLEFQTLVTRKEEITERLKGIKVDIRGSILTSGLLIIKCGDEELKFGCRPQSPKDQIDISLVYIPSQGLKAIEDKDDL